VSINKNTQRFALMPLFGLLLVSQTALAQTTHFITYDGNVMGEIKQKIQQQDGTYRPAWQALQKQADQALSHANYSVTDKTLLPASGNKHDYFSFGPYWWPNPATADHLPYIRKDGEINPDSKTDATDSVRLSRFAKDMRLLGLAWYYSGDKKYAEKAASMAKAWFVDPATRMTPDMQHAQAIPGVVDGRGIGIIDSRAFIDVMDAIELIRSSDALNDADYAAIKTWYSQFNDWLITSEYGFEESNWHNNHSAFYAAQVTAFALFTGNTELAKRQLAIAKIRLIPSQINNQGYLPAENERTRSWHYTQFALAAYARLARYGELAGVDLWQTETDGRSLQKALTVVAEQVDSSKTWPFPELKFNEEEAVGNVLAAARAYNTPLFEQKAEYLKNKYPENINLLMVPASLVP